MKKLAYKEPKKHLKSVFHLVSNRLNIFLSKNSIVFCLTCKLIENFNIIAFNFESREQNWRDWIIQPSILT